METKATPRPWIKGHENKRYGTSLIEINGTGNYPGSCISMDILGAIVHVIGQDEEAHANAELIVRCVNGFDELEAENAKLKAFKKYVHDRLDAYGVPVDPESPHKAHGCRIGGRLDWVEAENKRIRDALQAVIDQIENEHCSEYMEEPFNKAKEILKQP